MNPHVQIDIIVAEDDLIFRRDICAELLELDSVSSIYEARDGKEVLEYLSAKKGNLVITDINMPGLGGIELMKEIQHIYPGLKVVALSSHSAYIFKDAMFINGAYGYISKNAHKKELTDCIKTAINNGPYQLKEKICAEIRLKNAQFRSIDIIDFELKDLVLLCEENVSKERDNSALLAECKRQIASE